MKTSPLTKQALFLTVGYPGSGKTHMARQLAERLNIPRISADRIRFDLFDKPQYTKDEDAIVFRILDYMTEELLNAGQSVICDGDFGLRKSRRLKKELANKHGAVTVVLWVQTDLVSSFTRASTRNSRKTDDKYSPSIDKNIFDRLVAKLKKPEKERVIVVSGKHAFPAQFANIKSKLLINGLLARPKTDLPPKKQVVAEVGDVQSPRKKMPLPRNRQPLQIDLKRRTN